MSDMCGELDCSLAFAHVAARFNLTRPILTENTVIDIRGGRHLLQEQCVPAYVPNDTWLVGGHGVDEDHAINGPSMIMLTGPNYSGKSVYQKQVALKVYMAQLGSFVAADSATLGITDKILTRLATRETVSKAQSAFMIGLQQIALALHSCTRRSLVVIDEFGQGTDASDGEGLAAGVFCHLLSLGSQAPKCLVATHFHEIFEGGWFNDMPNLAFAHMHVRIDPHANRHEQQSSEVTYLYKLRPGRSDLSYGIQCAALNGISAEIVGRAFELARLSRQGEDLVALCSALSPGDEENLARAERAGRGFLQEDWDPKMAKDELMAALDAILAA